MTIDNNTAGRYSQLQVQPETARHLRVLQKRLAAVPRGEDNLDKDLEDTSNMTLGELRVLCQNLGDAPEEPEPELDELLMTLGEVQRAIPHLRLKDRHDLADSLHEIAHQAIPRAAR